MARIVIDKPGQLTTVQDFGRPALRRAGFPTGGAVDRVALRLANLLVGNAENTAALECALVGPVLRFTHDIDIAITGAHASGLPHRQRFRVHAGERVNLSRLDAGAYAYVAIAGGIDVPEVLGSRSTDVRLHFGGYNGRMLRTGDELTVLNASNGSVTDPTRFQRPSDFSRHVPASTGSSSRPRTDISPIGPKTADLHDRPPGTAIRILPAPDADRLPIDWPLAPFTISSKSDRVGVRLDGPQFTITTHPTAASGPVFPGTIQLPPDGVPIVLLADAQTLGGYPQIGHVISVDLPRLAQTRPGHAVRFEPVTLDEAHRLARRQERAFAFLRYGLRATMPGGADDRPQL